jgi:oxalate decarboxylase
MSLSRRTVLSTAAVGIATVAAANAQTPNAPAGTPQPTRPGRGGTDPGPRNVPLELQNPDIYVPPATDHGTVANLKFPFSQSHMRLERGGWTRQVTERELGISKNIAGVDMRLNTGGVRELHWHKAAEWAYMLYGRARIPDGCEFLLVFDDGSFSEDNTFLISDWFKHVPPDVLAKNFGVPASSFASTPDPSELYIFPLPVPGPLASDRIPGASPVPQSFSHRLMAQDPIRTKSGTVRIADSKNFPASVTIAAALVEILPGGMRELHWHPNTDEWQYYIEGQGRMGVFASAGDARTFDYQAGDVGFVPFAMGHYIENTGTTPLRFLEMFKSSYYADVSLNRWMALTPPELVQGTLKLDATVMGALRKGPAPVVPA